MIIALGESIVITGATAAELRARRRAVGRVRARLPRHRRDVVAVLRLRGRIAERRLELAEHRTLLARDAYTYLHVVMVAGVIVAAVGDELVIAHPTETLHGAEVVGVVAGPAIYLLAQALFRLRMAGTVRQAPRPAPPPACRRRCSAVASPPVLAR